jgi:hypothetical protein
MDSFRAGDYVVVNKPGDNFFGKIGRVAEEQAGNYYLVSFRYIKIVYHFRYLTLGKTKK